MRAKLSGLFASDAWLKAIAILILWLLLDPQPAPLPLVDDLLAGRAAARAGEAALAADRLAAAYARLPWNAGLALQAGLAELAAGRYQIARRHLLIASALGEASPTLQVSLGDAYSALGDSARAVQQWETALPDLLRDPAADPALVEATLNRLSQHYLQSARRDRAADLLRELAARRPGDAGIRYRLALLAAVRDPAAALPELELAAALSPELALTALPLRAAIREALAQGDPAYPYGVVGFRLIQLKEYPLAAEALRQAILINHDYADAYAYLGLTLEEQGQDGLDSFQKAVALAPDSALAHALLGLHWQRAGRNDLALPELQTAFDLDPANPAAAAQLGAVQAALSKLDVAEAWYLRAVELAPGSVDFRVLLARFYSEHEIKLRGAGLAAAREAAALGPDSAPANDALGYTLYLLGELDQAEGALARALTLQPDLAPAHYHLGLVRIAQNRPAEAREQLNLAIQSDPQGPYGNLALRSLAALSPR
ncbi:MAG: tetratricopeptide repeat protein [Chloroflexi bacterium]|nr:tetratricopeptide repeat protein [Chloroflexota bacterium]